MKLQIGSYLIESDSLQFIVKEKGTVQEGRFTKEENIGKEKETTIAYCTRFEDALKFVPQHILRSNNDIEEIRRQLDEIHDAILYITELPVIYVKPEKEEKENVENE